MSRNAGHLFLLVWLIGILSLIVHPSASEELHNLEIIFRKSYNDWEGDSIKSFGSDVSSAGDLNGDGYDDIAAAGWILRPPGWSARIFVFYGGVSMDTIPDLILRDDYSGGSPWVRLASGDVNADGFSDIVVGLPYGPGNVDVYFGGNPMDTVVDLCIFEEPPESFFGCAVATGDVNGDGYCDIVASDYDKDNVGVAYVFHGGPLLDHIPDVTLRGHGYEGFGTSVGSGGDVNSDGYDDVAVGAWNNGDVHSSAGKVYVYYGGNPMDTVYDVGLHGEGAGQHLGWGDVGFGANLGGHDFFVTGTEFWPRGFAAYSPGKLYVLFGGDLMDSIPDISFHGQTDSTSLGQRSTCADVNGDGVDDIFSGATTEDEYRGAVYLWLTGGGMDTIPDAWMKGESLFSMPGWQVASAGDVDADGRDEIVFSNYALQEPWHTVWVCKYTGTGIHEDYAFRLSSLGRGRITCSPNPFKYHTIIEVSSNLSPGKSGDSGVLLTIHDIAGRTVKSFEIARQVERFTWDGCDEAGRTLPNGVYFLSILPGQAVPPAKLTLVR